MVMIPIHGSRALVLEEVIGEAHQLVLGIIILAMVINKILVPGLLEEIVVQCEVVELQDLGLTIVILYFIQQIIIYTIQVAKYNDYYFFFPLLRWL